MILIGLILQIRLIFHIGLILQIEIQCLILQIVQFDNLIHLMKQFQMKHFQAVLLNLPEEVVNHDLGQQQE